MKLVLLFSLITAIFAQAEDLRVTALLVQGDAQERQGQTRAALATFQQAEQIEPGNVGVLLRIAKQYSDLIAEAKSPAAAEQTAQKALEYSRRALRVDPQNAKAHLSVAVCYGKLTDFASNKAKIEYSKIVREEVGKSLALDASDDYAWHVLGRWHFGVANVSVMLRAVAKMVYGGLPAASNEEAIKCLKKATELAPQRILHRAALARVYRDIGKPDLAAKEWQAIIALPAAGQDEEREKSAAKLALQSR